MVLLLPYTDMSNQRQGRRHDIRPCRGVSTFGGGSASRAPCGHESAWIPAPCWLSFTSDLAVKPGELSAALPAFYRHGTTNAIADGGGDCPLA
jgi:hypothetical protein